MNSVILKAEIMNDPLVRGYSGMTDIQITEDINSVYCKTNKATMTGSEILNAIPDGVLKALSSVDQERVWRIIHIGNINPFGLEADLFIDIFGVQSATITSLQTLRKNDVSRGVELGIGVVKEGYVAMARS